MSRLPTVGGDTDTWGTVLNDYLTQNIPASYTLGSSSSAGATAVTIDRIPAGIVEDGSYVAVGATTSKCEIRRVTGIASAVLTLSSDLAYDHASGEFVWVLPGTLVPLEWFGCKANDASFDSFMGLQQALNDLARGGRGWGITGHDSRYYTQTPICISDNIHLDRIIITAKSPISFDITTGLRETYPDTFHATLAGQFGTISSVDTGTNVITLSTTAGSEVGDRLIFYPLQGATLPAPLEAGRAYYLLTNPGANQYTISKDSGGSTVDFSSSGSGTSYFYSTGLARMRWDFVTFEGANIQALNGVLAFLQQPSVARSLRIDEYPGYQGAAVFSGQQAEFFSCIFAGSYKGLSLRGMQFLYMVGANFEGNDILMETDSPNPHGSGSTNRDIQILGTHWESPGNAVQRVRTIVGDAGVSAGNFTFTFDGQTTGNIAYNAPAATIQTALETLSNIDPGDVTCVDEAGGLPGGRVEITFAGQYLGANLSAKATTVGSGGLTGGTYSVSTLNPDSRALSIRSPTIVFCLYGGVFSNTGALPDGSYTPFLINESGDNTSGYTIQNVCTMNGVGNVVEDSPRGLTVSWADVTGVGEQAYYISAPAVHGGTVAKNWMLAGLNSGMHLAWEAYSGELRLNGTGSKLRFGDTGPALTTHSGSPEGAVTAPPGSICADSTNGVLYMKKSGTGNTGWKLVTQAA